MAETPSPVIKERRVFRDTDAAYRRKRRRDYRAMAIDCVRYICRRGESPPASFRAHPLPDRFFGMNVAASPEPEADPVIIQTLRELGVQALRIDIAPGEESAPAHRLAECLLQSGYPLTLHLVQDPDEAAAMDSEPARRSWRRRVDSTLECYGGRIEAIEVGSTPNRHSWSGYTPSDYATSCRIAQEAIHAWGERTPGARTVRPLLVGPNISDFAPYFTVGQLAECARQGVRLDVMSDNLFIDRSGEPERFDPHIAGDRLSGLTRMDLVRKQRILASIALRHGIRRSWCTYTHYTLNFGIERRRYVSEDQYANYMVRTHLLSAAAGCFDRYFWGTLVSHFKGLIDETVRLRPYPPFVHHRFATQAPPAEWRRREKLIAAYRTMTAQMRRARFIRRWRLPESVRVLEFETPEGRLIVGWTRDGQTHDLDLMIADIDRLPSRCILRDGEQVDAMPKIQLSESPIFLR